MQNAIVSTLRGLVYSKRNMNVDETAHVLVKFNYTV